MINPNTPITQNNTSQKERCIDTSTFLLISLLWFLGSVLSEEQTTQKNFQSMLALLLS